MNFSAAEYEIFISILSDVTTGADARARLPGTEPGVRDLGKCEPIRFSTPSVAAIVLENMVIFKKNIIYVNI